MADAQPADDKPAEDVAMADAKPAEAEAAELQHQESAEQADDKPAEEAEDDKPAELQDMPAQEPAEQAEDDKPAEEAEDDMPAQEPDAAPAEPSDSSQGAGPVQGLRTTDKGNGWHELMARTLEEYTADLEIIKRRLNDGTIDKVSLRWSPTRWTQEIYHINSQQKLALKTGKRSVLPRDALVQVHVA